MNVQCDLCNKKIDLLSHLLNDKTLMSCIECKDINNIKNYVKRQNLNWSNSSMYNCSFCNKLNRLLSDSHIVQNITENKSKIVNEIEAKVCDCCTLRKSTNYCHECKTFFCQSCRVEKHNKFKKYKNHCIFTNEFQTDTICCYCSIGTSDDPNLIEHYCCDCSTSMCSNCNSKDHYNHNTLLINNYKVSYTDRIKQFMVNKTKLLYYFNSFSDDLNNKVDTHIIDFNNQISILINYLLRFKDEYVNNIIKEKTEIITKLNLFKEIFVKTLDQLVNIKKLNLNDLILVDKVLINLYYDFTTENVAVDDCIIKQSQLFKSNVVKSFKNTKFVQMVKSNTIDERLMELNTKVLELQTIKLISNHKSYEINPFGKCNQIAVFTTNENKDCIAWVGREYSIEIYDINKDNYEKIFYTGHTKKIYQIKHFIINGFDYLFTCSADNTCIAFNCYNWCKEFTISIDKRVDSVIVFNDCKNILNYNILIGSNSINYPISVYNSKGKLVKTIEIRDGLSIISLNCFKYNDCNYIVICSYNKFSVLNFETENIVNIFEASNIVSSSSIQIVENKPLIVITEHSGNLRIVDFTSSKVDSFYIGACIYDGNFWDDNYLILACGDGSLKIYGLKERSVLKEYTNLHNQAINAIKFNNRTHGNFIITYGSDGIIKYLMN